MHLGWVRNVFHQTPTRLEAGCTLQPAFIVFLSTFCICLTCKSPRRQFAIGRPVFGVLLRVRVLVYGLGVDPEVHILFFFLIFPLVPSNTPIPTPNPPLTRKSCVLVTMPSLGPSRKKKQKTKYIPSIWTTVSLGKKFLLPSGFMIDLVITKLKLQE